MDASDSQAERYLNELYQRTAGNAGAQVSMFEIGAAVGLEKEEARKLAEDLIADGLVEIKTLSGGIGITAEGINMAQPAGGSKVGASLELGDGPLLEEKGRQALESILNEIKNSLASSRAPYASLEEMVLDIKTIDIQLLSPRPKIAIIKEILRSLKNGLDTSGASTLALKMEKMIGG